MLQAWQKMLWMVLARMALWEREREQGDLFALSEAAGHQQDLNLLFT